MDELDNIPSESIIYVSNKFATKEIIKDLMKIGFKREQIILRNDIHRDMLHEQYFDRRYWPHFRKSNDIFVDAGCCTEEDTLKYWEVREDYSLPVYAFEPDEKIIIFVGIIWNNMKMWH